MSFTSGGVFLAESIKLAELYLHERDWSTVHELAVKENLLQLRTLSSSKRLVREIIARLRTLDESELHLLVTAPQSIQSALLWIAICRHYPFIREFAAEVLRHKFLTMEPGLEMEDFDAFFDRKAEWDPKLDQIMPSTRKKLRQVLFRILREARLVADNRQILETDLDDTVLGNLSPENLRDILAFPTRRTGR